MKKVEIWYFKRSGKFYSDGEYISDKQHNFEIYGELKEMLARGEWPGLIGACNFTVVLVRIMEKVNSEWVESDVSVPAVVRLAQMEEE